MNNEDDNVNSSGSENNYEEPCCKDKARQETCGCGGGFSSFRLFVFVIIVIAAVYMYRMSRPLEMPQDWSSDLAASQQLAASDGKDVLIAFHTSWCVYCTKMKEEVYDKSKFKSFADKNLVLVMLDGDKENELLAKYNVQGFPSYVVLDSAGQVKSVFAGYRPADDFLAELSKAVAR